MLNGQGHLPALIDIHIEAAGGHILISQGTVPAGNDLRIGVIPFEHIILNDRAGHADPEPWFRQLVQGSNRFLFFPGAARQQAEHQREQDKEPDGCSGFFHRAGRTVVLLSVHGSISDRSLVRECFFRWRIILH